MDLIPLHTLVLITMARMNQHPPTHQLGILSTGGGGISHLVDGCALRLLTFLVLTLSLVVFFPPTLRSPAQLHTTYPLRINSPPPPLTYLPTRSTPLFPT